jgi:hypothetical protein
MKYKLLTLLLIPFLLNAQPDTIWTQTYGDTTSGNAVQQTADGHYILTGTSQDGWPSGYGNVWLALVDTAGTPMWTREYDGGYAQAGGISVLQTIDGGYLIYAYAGPLDVYPGGEILLIKVDDSGDLIWTRNFGGFASAFSNSIQQTSDGGFILIGSITPPDGGYCDIWLLKLDAVGDSIWTKTYGQGGSSRDLGYSVQQTLDDGYVITGSLGEDVWLLKTDSLGDTTWTRTYVRGGLDRGRSVQQTSDGGYIILGSSLTDSSSSFDLWLLKVDTTGDTAWTRIIEGVDTGGPFEGAVSCCGGTSVQQTSDGGYILTGTTSSYGAENEDLLMAKIDALGNIDWIDTYGGGVGRSVQQTSDGGYIVVRSSPDGAKLIRFAPETGIVSIGYHDNINPTEFSLHHNYPNPFNPTTTISYDLSAAYDVMLSVLDITGREITTLVQSGQSPGSYEVQWNGIDQSGNQVSTGVYFARLQAGEYSQAIKMLYLK